MNAYDANIIIDPDFDTVEIATVIHVALSR